MAAHLAYTSLPVTSTCIHELDQVVVRTDVEGDEGETIREGSRGTVLSVLGDGAAYLVEFGSQRVSDAGHPIPVFATIELAKLKPIPGAARADLASSFSH
ncbi:hypothetical protein [Methylobacterium platani]|uniref:DUF4926 domain-containing protein n=2 Tax=Methylobacterium platani TaxID=427683 RepID=A0A179SI71_9HYPH|nr:hypothetical protein [Methylobacterium platani]KMO12585.1 hypothetical protein SQ03_24030 [Methylobacterium platani JCM 14648]OAS26213.1 hypothetical protein A5481_06425 [Methylobacterium platani]